MDVCEYINTAQQESVIRIITERCRRFRAFEQQFSSLFYDPYTTMRKKHTLTSAVISGFAPNNDGEDIIDGITSTTIYYGRNNKMAQPELRTENAVFHVYSDGASQKTDVVKTRCKLYNSDLSTPPIFLLVIFRASKKGELYGIDICIPNASGEIMSLGTMRQRTGPMIFNGRKRSGKPKRMRWAHSCFPFPNAKTLSPNLMTGSG